MSELNLDPCKHCGGRAEFDEDDGGYHWINCIVCGISTDTMRHADSDAKIELVNIWNRRAPEAGQKCQASFTSDPPRDCDFPFCGCDPQISKAMEVLYELGMLRGRHETKPEAAQESVAPYGWFAQLRKAPWHAFFVGPRQPPAQLADYDGKPLTWIPVSLYAQPQRPAVPEEVRAAVNRMCKPLDPNILSGATAEADARSMQVIKQFIDSLLTAAPAPERPEE